MSTADVERLRAIKTFPSLVKYLRDELEWPIESDDFDELTFDYEPEELGLDAKTAVKIKEIKQLRPLASNQPWGIFFVNFEPKRLPVVVLRRILRSLVIKKRQSANKPQQAAWQLHDLLFISAYGESEHRDITLANFSDDSEAGDLPTLKVLGWDDEDTVRHLAYSHDVLKEKLHWPENPADLDNWRRTWSLAFTLKHREVIGTSKEMAERMAELATAIRKRVNKVLAVESEKGPLRKLMTAFREALIHDLKEDDFADMYAQTITYGLLSARVSRPAGLVAENIRDMVPITNPFLRDLLSTFLTIGGRKGKVDFDELGINEVVQALRDANMEAVMRDFDDKNPQEDPVIHFYELFLKEYDPKKRMQRGVFFTPRPVVSFIVRSVDEILRKEFGLADGLADTTTWGEMAKRHPELKIPDGAKPDDPFVQILDPACGTGTFLVEVIDVIHQTMKAKWRSVAAVYDRRLEESRRSQTAATTSVYDRRLEESRRSQTAATISLSDRRPGLDFEFHDRWNEYVSDHLLPRLYGFELMMAPYAIAHMKIGLKLFETGYSFRSHERARIYLTNSLEPPQDFSDRFEFDAPALAHEAQAVNAIKRHQRFTVVIGNPPYSNYGQLNINPWIIQLIEEYKRDLHERKLNLDDDFIKFVRLGQWTVDRASVGLLGLITNHTYLEGVTHRRMRLSLLSSFTRLAFLDLHGNVRKSETGPGESQDKNVFDIQQGVAIAVFRKAPNSIKGDSVQHGDLWGDREAKYSQLSRESILLTALVDIHPTAPYFFFSQVNLVGEDEYKMAPSVVDIFPAYGCGFATSRDNFVTDYEQESLTGRLKSYFDTVGDEKALSNKFRIRSYRAFSVADYRREHRFDPSCIRRFFYRPFDERWVYYAQNIVQEWQRKTMQHLGQKDSLALITARLIKGETPNHFFASRWMVEKISLSNKTSNNAFAFPLYLYSHNSEQGALNLDNRGKTNISPTFEAQLRTKLKLEQAGHQGLPIGPAPEDIFHYAYAEFHSPGYRGRYAEFLKIDFPRLPLTSSLELFRALAKLGGELVALHLMESPKLEEYITKYAGKGDSEVAKGYPKFVAAVYDRRAEVCDRRNGSVASLNSRNELTPADRRSQTAATMTGSVYINPSRWFEGVPEDVWNFHIGGYQVCEKWLKDRRGRVLSEEDIAHYQKIVVALKETIRLMAEIDKVIDAHGGWPGAFVTGKKS